MYIELGFLELSLSNITDSIEQRIVLSIYSFLRIILYMTQIVLIQNRYKMQPLKARGRHILLLLILGTSLTEFILMFRIIYGREVFSCIIYTFLQFISIHSKNL
jgi:hypothetical protein